MNINIHDNNFHGQASMFGRNPSDAAGAHQEQQYFYIVAEANNINTGICLSPLFDTRDEAAEYLKESYDDAIASMQDDNHDEVEESSFDAEVGCYSIYSCDNDYYYGSIQTVRRFCK